MLALSIGGKRPRGVSIHSPRPRLLLLVNGNPVGGHEVLAEGPPEPQSEQPRGHGRNDAPRGRHVLPLRRQGNKKG